MDSSAHANREPARDRFASQELKLDFDEAAQRLLQESNTGQLGHRQIALYKSNHTTVALFAFEAGGRIPQHQAHATVLIQVLKGAIRVTTSEATHSLSSGQALVMSPDVPHDVVADEPSQMLLTVAKVSS